MDLAQYKKIISDAVEKEIAAFNFYSGVAQKVQDRNLKSIFTELADEEKSHRKLLEGYLTSQKQMRFDTSRDYRIAESVPRPPLTLEMKPVDAIAIAMKNEEAAVKLYSQLAENSDDPAQKEVFQSLANMEKGHKARLEDMYTNMAFPEAW